MTHDPESDETINMKPSVQIHDETILLYQGIKKFLTSTKIFPEVKSVLLDNEKLLNLMIEEDGILQELSL